MEYEKTIEQILEERRSAWAAASPRYMPVPVAAASAVVNTDPLRFLEDTVPLPRYRPERL